MSKSAARAGGRASGSGRMRRRSPLLGWGIAIAALLILGGGAWWYVSRHLGDLVSGMLKQRAGDSLNGRLEFSKLTIDLAGRAVLEDAAIYPEGGNEPLITCPRAVATLDFLTFFGPNRGKRAVVVDLHEPRFTLVREPGGRFNLARLLKPSEEEGEPIGVSVHLHNAQIEFTDWDLLGQSIWNVPEQSGLASKLLDELGNPASPSVEIPIHEELLTISGSVAINPERQELAFNLDIAREGGGGAVSVKGASALDGGEFDVDLDLEEVELTSVKSYANSLFPLLALSEAFPNSSDESRRPYLAGRITRGSINLTKLRQEAVQAGWTLELAELRYLSAHLPELYFPHLAANYSSDSKKLNTDFTLHALGCTVQGKPALDLASDELSGELSISGGDLRMLAREFTAKDLPFSGTAGAAVTLAGSLSAPRLEAKLSGKNLAYKQIKLGALEGTVAMNTPTIKLMDVKFSGGDLPLKINGSLELGKNNGKFSLLAGPLTAAHALDLAGRFGIEGDTASMDIKGSIRASAEVTLKGGKPSTALRFWSDRLMLAGLTLESADLRGTLAPPNFNIDVAEAVLVTAEQIDLAGFTSEGPLQLDVRASGSISKLESGSAALALVGEAATRNLAPEAAKLSFKVLGPANDPEIRVQIKTAHADNPLLVSGKGYYRKGFAPVTASRSWYETTVDFSGEVDFVGRRMEGELTADAIDLARFVSGGRISGVLSAMANLGGTFGEPTVSGHIELPQLAFATARRTYRITGAEAGFKLAGGSAVSISAGKFNFEGNAFSAKGVLGREGGDLTFSCPGFDLLSLIALVSTVEPQGGKAAYTRPPLQIESSGPLTVRLIGELENPTAAIDYQSGPGSVEGHRFTGAVLRASATKERATISHFQITSPEGSISADGGLVFSPFSFDVKTNIERFDAAVVAPLTGLPILEGLSGILDGELNMAGTPDQYTAGGTLRLTQGVFHGVEITQASADLDAVGSRIEITNVQVVAEGTTISANATIGPNPADTTLQFEAASMELALLAPFLPENIPELAGRVSLKVQMNPGRAGFPDMDVELRDAGGPVTFGGVEFSSIDALASTRNGELEIERCLLATPGGTLNAGGNLSLEAFASGGSRKGGKKLDFWVSSKEFNFGDLAPLLPAQYRELVPEGTISGELALAGTSTNPLLSSKGDITFDLAGLPGPVPVKIGGISGAFSISRNDFDIKRVSIIAGPGGSFADATMRGSGRISLIPFGFVSGDIDIELAPQGQFTRLEHDMFSGTLGGRLIVRGSADAKPAISGSLVVTEPGGRSIISYKAPEVEQQPAAYRFDNLEVLIQPGTSFRYAPVRLQADLSGSLTINGVPGADEHGPDALTIKGDLKLPKGSMFYLGHVIRLDLESNRVHFEGEPGNLFPYFTGRGAVTLPRVLKGDEILASAGPQLGAVGGGVGQVAAGQDLTVYFHFNRASLDPASGDFDDPGKFSLSSDPPLSQQAIIGFLAGEVTGLVGEMGGLASGRTQITEFAEAQLLSYGASFISHAIEQQLDFTQFRIGGTGEMGNPFYVDVEREVTPIVSLTYFRDFYNEAGQSEEYGVKYRLFEQRHGSRYQNLDLQLNFEQSAIGGSGSEFMFTWSTRF